MFMRKLLVAVGPVLLCLLTCQLFRWLDSLFAAGSFFLYALKGISLGACLALVLTLCGVTTKNTGLTGLLYIAAGLLLVVLIYQYLETVGVVNWPAFRAIMSINGQVIWVESAVMAYSAITAALHGRRHTPAVDAR